MLAETRHSRKKREVRCLINMTSINLSCEQNLQHRPVFTLKKLMVFARSITETVSLVLGSFRNVN